MKDRRKNQVKSTMWSFMMDDGRIKVIGNAYENPELIEPKEGSEKNGH